MNHVISTVAIATVIGSTSIAAAGGVARYQSLGPFRAALEGELREDFDSFENTPVVVDALPNIFVSAMSGLNRDGEPVEQVVSAVEDLEFDLLGGQAPPSAPNIFSNDPSADAGFATGQIQFNFSEPMDAIGFFVADGSSNSTFYIQLFSGGDEIAMVVSNGPRVLPNSFLGVISDVTFDSAVIGGTNERDSWAIDDLYVHYIEPQDCPADFDGDDIVGFNDLTQILSEWGECGKDCPEDLDGDGTVGFEDLVELLSLWGDCPG